MKIYSQKSFLDLTHIAIMGILNLTPDSFSDGNKYNTLSKALTHTKKMIKDGAKIIDIGGESSRPGAKNITAEEELERIMPILEAIIKRFDIWISVDTSKPEVMKEVKKVGVHMINDVRALQLPGALNTAYNINLPICLTHNPLKNIRKNFKKYDILREVDCFLQKKISKCKSIGIKMQNILIDPGFGFQKNHVDNYQLLANLTFLKHFKLPILVGISRKTMISQILKKTPIQCLSGNLSCIVIAAMQNVQIVRVHDVKETSQAIKIVEMIKYYKKDEYN
ncbi:dihydropteroate synthase [Candidatus Tachikawaea gelatinosa]|uniref:dihydropteroate synthase n=1 Tax=Candidatus Tachikawaea gelatinosa TaxID=1410383 RepID=A0A090ASJ6_9ENTR|nr:dihydropteroate synthase [Candidatus Tachikawaea gelatinosa]BAP58855.1 dihydropteroate synthase [Candidatus Tachikawaea gelatinosa]